MNDCYKFEKYLLMTLDPVHVGTGGMRLGRVDNSIVREPGTKLPKIPGTALHGAIRQYAAYRYESRRCAGSGQNKDDNKSHYKDAQCPICYTFGYLKGQDGGQSGVVSIGDARLLLFPVYSMAGPVWVTCPSVLDEFGVSEADPGNQVRLPEALNKHDHLNLGWLMLPKASETFTWPEDKIKDVPEKIKQRAVLISDKLFSQVVNSNLEVRTSVSIDPETGAAKEGALFTYEAIPRATLLWLDVVEDDFKQSFPETQNKCKVEEVEKDGEKVKKYTHNAGEPLGETWTKPLDVVRAGLTLAEMLGVGGMGTRGFGRVRLLKEEIENDRT